jgi:NodT family efflux transporter outer membrane factor (OMF) lipoprotein
VRLGVLFLAACAVGPNFKRPPAPEVKGYTAQPLQPTAAAAGQAQRFVESDQLAAEWWRLLHCRALDALIAEAMAGNPGLQAAEAALRRAQNALRAGYGVFSPQVDLNASFSRQQFTPSRFGAAAPPSVFNLFTLGATVSYALDIWGGQRRGVEALRAQMEGQRYTVTGAYLMLQGNVVGTAIAAAAYADQIRVTEELIAAEKEQVRISEVQAQAGTAPWVNLLSLQSQVAATQATLPPLRQRLDQARHLLAALVGKTPAEWTPPAIALADLTLPGELPVSLPSQLVRQRPDILVAEAQLHSATAQIGVATAALLPNITLGGNVGVSSESIVSLFTPGSLFWTFTAGLLQPLLHGGTLWYQRKQAIDARDQALADYRQTVVGAFQQVADTLRALDHDAQTLAAQAEAVTTAQGAFQLVQASYQAGVASYLQLLTADTQLLQARIGYVQAQAQRIQDTVGLFVALGGGWWNRPK